MNQPSPQQFSPRRPQLRSEGFTLIELLITIGIIAVLAALLTPVLTSMQKKAGATQCVSNLRQVYAYFIDDTQQSDEMPMAWNGSSGWVNTKYDALKLEKSNGYKAFGCPVQRKALHLTSDARTYSMNGQLVNEGWKNPSPARIPKYRDPSKVAVITDGGLRDGAYNASVTNANRPECIHNGKANIAFLDGHVAALSLTEIPDTATPDGSLGSIFWLGR